jgi:hypothetical protein
VPYDTKPAETAPALEPLPEPAPEDATEPAAQRRTWARRASRGARRLPAACWLVTGLWALLLAAGTIVWPATYGLDESQHIDMAYAYSDSLHLYRPAERTFSAAVTNIQQFYVGHPLKRSLATATIPPRGARPSLADLGGGRPLGKVENPMVQHPPAYYVLAGAVLRIPAVERLPFDQAIALVRLLSVLCLLPLPALCWLAARRLGMAEPVALAGAVVPLGIPGLVRTGSVVTNDALLVLSGSVLTYLLIRVVTGDLRRRTAAGVAAALATALLTKGFALALPPVVGLCYLIAARRHRTVPVAPAAIAASGAALGGLWWLRNLLLFHAVQPSGYRPGWADLVYQPATFQGRFATFLPSFLNAFVNRMWGGLGIPDQPAQPPLLVWGWVTIVSAGVLVTLLTQRPPPLTRGTAAVLLLPFVLAVAIVISGSWPVYHKFVRFVGVQGRYGYVGILGLIVVAVAGLGQLVAPAFLRRLPVVLLALALGTELSALVVLTDDWFTAGPQPLPAKLHQGVAALLNLSPWPRPLTALPFVLAAVLAAGCLRLLARPGRTGPLGAPPPRPAEAAAPAARS